MAYYKKRNKEVVSKEMMKKIIGSYFLFLDGKYRIRNEKLMNGLKKK
jgi:hypothetical protein